MVTGEGAVGEVWVEERLMGTGEDFGCELLLSINVS